MLEEKEGKVFPFQWSGSALKKKKRNFHSFIDFKCKY